MKRPDIQMLAVLCGHCEEPMSPAEIQESSQGQFRVHRVLVHANCYGPALAKVSPEDGEPPKNSERKTPQLVES